MENDKVKNLATLIATADVSQDSEIGNDDEDILNVIVNVNKNLAFYATSIDGSDLDWAFAGENNQERTAREATKLGVSARDYWSIVEPMLNDRVSRVIGT